MSPEQRSGGSETEGTFRERVLHALAQWQHRLAGSGVSSPAPAAIAREVAELRVVAQSRGWPTAQHLLYLENVAQTAPHTLSQALSAMANVLRMTNIPVSPYTMPLAQAGQRRGLGATPVPGSAPPGHAVAPPASPLPSRESDSIAPPPLIGAGQSIPDAKQVGPTGGLPESQRKPRPPPNLLKSILGLSAIWKRAEPRARGLADSGLPAGPLAPLAPQPKGLFGFRTLSSEAARPMPSPTPARGFDPKQGRAWQPGRSGRPQSAERERAPQWRGLAATPESAVPRWFYLLIGLVGLLGVATIAIIIVLGRHPKESREVSASASSTPGPAMPTVDSPAEKRAPASKVWQKRGSETPELLRALLDLQGKLASSCRDDPATCGGRWTPLAREALTPLDVRDLTPSATDAPLPAWLRQLKLPREMPVRDELALRNAFNFHTRHTVGKAAMQAMLFECSAYSEIFERAFIQYGAPPWLAAVAFQESGCNPRATSPVGAKGLWQFMPESARIYGLRVTEGEIDERLNPVKSTDAAIHFLTDLERMLGAWDLTLAAYNMGPFAIVKRLEQFGGNIGFWDLVHAHVLPEETAGYVPAIEAYALVLDNLSFLKFSRDGKRPEGTAEVNVKPGTRLSLIARAASTTTVHIRELNPEFLRDVVPEGETTVRVPDSEAYRAQAFLETWARSPDDNRDTCVPDNFDWGAKQFERSEFAKSCAAAP